MDDNGVISALNFRNMQWSPIIDLKQRYPGTYKNFWIVGLMENELLAIEMTSGLEQPPLTLKNKHKVVKLAIPLLNQDKEDVDSKEMTLPQMEEQHIRDSFFFSHEQFRKEVWEPLKLFRSQRDPERVLSESILDAKKVAQQKKELDKHIIQCVRLAIMNDEHDKVFTYLELLNFSQSLKICIRLCNDLN